MDDHFRIRTFQNGALYEGHEVFYYIISNNDQTLFRMMKIDRQVATQLSIHVDGMIYNAKEVNTKLKLFYEKSHRNGGAVRHITSTYGLLGFVRFLEGYYIIVITKRACVATIGGHYVYCVADTKMVYIPTDQRNNRSEETKTLQYNMTASKLNADPSRTAESEHVPCSKFIWNKYLLSGIEHKLHPDWILHVIHGFVAQSDPENMQGDVANDVETEQIVFDTIVTSLQSGRFTSYVQLRASVPAYWSQVYSGMAPKPPISVDRVDPYAVAAGHHFNFCLKHYGAPIVVLNLVKKKDKKPFESLLSNELETTIEYLNQFLPNEHKIQYVAWDMSRVSKRKDGAVISWLEKFAEESIKKTGFFHSGPQLHFHKMLGDSLKSQYGHGYSDSGCLQTGVLRLNCVDCLDRTNTAQFMIGKIILAVQLYSLGILDSLDIQFETPAVKLLEELYESQGDTLALQYGGSQLVHRPWEETESLWDLRSDYHLHNKPKKKSYAVIISYTQWLEREVFDYLPYPYGMKFFRKIEKRKDKSEKYDLFYEFYRPFSYTSLEWCWGNYIFSTRKTFAPPSVVDPHPFTAYASTKPVVKGIYQYYVCIWKRVRSKYKIAPRNVAGTPSLIDEEGSSDEDGRISSDEESKPMPTSATRDSVRHRDHTASLQRTPSLNKKDLYEAELQELPPKDVSEMERYIHVENFISATPLGDSALEGSYTKITEKYEPHCDLHDIVDPDSFKAFKIACDIGVNDQQGPCTLVTNKYQ
ncbi:uncharacterized protein TRIADDRAFT_56303 [Trichoplax adhaerens]|uniref:SAC domain-containing protein n=1 Tax=Trichoplax adhaerens TaxID=10228 RepID=B3RXR6_TRIAD|nr:hypothetical protein TRIADDRAFT_56303 [Trichoplax adhaerens]EDV24476.1 hypothetical protein TRIADDRAFT_56303 [Trichoplax adhaerens]|eukprot:XP_002112366.1 hypothetical protein TRIADDRAFT_56303 [Trichoplax adhaerens]